MPLVHDIADELSKHVPVWQLPLAASVVPNLVQAAGAEVLTPKSFIPVAHSNSFLDGTPLNGQFRSAVELLRDWLARKDPVLAHSLSVPWETLFEPRIVCEPDLGIELSIDGHASPRVRASTHLSHDPLTFYFISPEVIGEDNVGGAILASLFSDGDRDKLALAWSKCWSNAEAGFSGSVNIVEDEADDSSLQSLFDQASSNAVTSPSIRSRRTRPKRQDNDKAPSEPEVRRLKSFEQFSDKTIGLLATDEKNKSKKSSRRGLRDRTPKGQPIGLGRKPASRSAPLDYSEKDKEDLALQILQLAINGEVSELRDYRHLRGVGADALDKLRRYFEVKAHYGPMPDEITLTANEIERASIEREKFFLAVISGLEEGYETVVKIIPNPLKNLKPKSSTSVTLAGVSSARSGIEVRFPEQDEKQNGH